MTPVTDARGFYAELRIALPGRGTSGDVSVRCFASPAAHKHDDRNPSCSVSLDTGQWKCWTCGAAGSAFDAAVALGRSRSDAADLAKRYGVFLGERTDDRPNKARSKKAAPLPPGEQLSEWAQQLLADDRVLARLRGLRGWSREAVASLGIGYDGERIVFPIRDREGQLVNACRYTPNPKDGERKMLARARRPRDLFPAPETLAGEDVWIVEGEGDAVAAATLGLPATALPGVEAASRLDVERFRRFHRVYVSLDCDRQGREAAGRIASALTSAGIEVRVLDLDPARDDGYDLGDWTCEAAVDGQDGLACAARLLKRMADMTEPVAREPNPDTSELLEQIIGLLRRFVVMPGEAETVAVTLYVLHTWALEGAHATPYLLVISPERRSGKTRLLEVLRLLVRAPWHTTSTSEAALFRKIERDAPTLLLDEIDAIFGSNSERTEPLRAVLNSGNRRGVTVTRCVGKEHDVGEFSVWCAKVLAGIDKDRRLPDTIRDRAIPIRMRRKHDAENIARLRERKAAELAAPIRERAAAWAAAFTSDLYDSDPQLPDELDDRAADAWEPLLAIAELAGGVWPQRARTAALGLSADGEADGASIGTLLLGAIRGVFGSRGRVTTDELLKAINEDDELPFGSWRDGKGLSAYKLSALLKPYTIKSKDDRYGAKTFKGYRAEDFRDAWTRYLDGSTPTVSGSEAQQDDYPQDEIARQQRGVADVADVADYQGMGAQDATDALGDGNGHHRAPRNGQAVPADNLPERFIREFDAIELTDDCTNPLGHVPEHHPHPNTGRTVCWLCHQPAAPDLAASAA